MVIVFQAGNEQSLISSFDASRIWFEVILLTVLSLICLGVTIVIVTIRFVCENGQSCDHDYIVHLPLE